MSPPAAKIESESLPLQNGAAKETSKPAVDWSNIALVNHLDEKNFEANTTNGFKKLDLEMSKEQTEEEEKEVFENLDLKIMGIGVEYPPNNVFPGDLEVLSTKFCKQNDAMKKVLSVNKYTGIIHRSSIGTSDHPIANMPTPPSISQLHEIFYQHAVPLSITACKKALDEAKYHPSSITHSVFNTCTDSANPGFDHFVLKELGTRSSVQRILLHGVGCSGGLAALRTACNVALGAKARGKRARVLVCAAEVSTVLVRSELESVELENKVRVGLCLFSDCASAVVISNGIGEDEQQQDSSLQSNEHDEEKGVFEIRGWANEVVPDTEHELGFDVDKLGWKVVLTPKVPLLTSLAVPRVFPKLVSSIPTITNTNPADYDWALHPGGSLILTSIEKAMNLTPEHLMASYEVYMNHGNSSSATIFSVMNTLRQGKSKDAREDVVACAFGPGISVEMMMLRRIMKPQANGAATATTNGHHKTNTTQSNGHTDNLESEALD